MYSFAVICVQMLTMAKERTPQKFSEHTVIARRDAPPDFTP
jgi:hypothetical protein